MKQIAQSITINVSHAVEMIAAISISMALLTVIINLAQSYYHQTNRVSMEHIRLQFGTSVAVSLEFFPRKRTGTYEKNGLM